MPKAFRREVVVVIADKDSKKKNEVVVAYREVSIPILKSIGPLCIHREYDGGLPNEGLENVYKLTHTATGYFILRARGMKRLEDCAKKFLKIHPMDWKTFGEMKADKSPVKKTLRDMMHDMQAALNVDI